MIRPQRPHGASHASCLWARFCPFEVSSSGQLRYMPPEQLEGKPVAARADLASDTEGRERLGRVTPRALEARLPP
jgi:hypothetical protein